MLYLNCYTAMLLADTLRRLPPLAAVVPTCPSFRPCHIDTDADSHALHAPSASCQRGMGRAEEPKVSRANTRGLTHPQRINRIVLESQCEPSPAISTCAARPPRSHAQHQGSKVALVPLAVLHLLRTTRLLDTWSAMAQLKYDLGIVLPRRQKYPDARPSALSSRCANKRHAAALDRYI